MRRLFLLLAVLFFAAPALADGPAKPPKAAPGTSVEMPFLAAPMSDKDGKLLGYAYISSRLVCVSLAAAVQVRKKVAFIQDANVRDVHAKPVAMPGDPIAVDKDALALRLTQNAKRVAGEALVVRADILQTLYTPLHPSDSAPPAAAQAAPGTAPAPNAGTAGAPGTGSTAGNATAATSQPQPGAPH